MTNIINLLNGLYNAFLDLLFPEKNICFICEEHLDEIKSEHICSQCRRKLIFLNEHRCSVCGKPLEVGYLPDKCHECIKETRYFKKAIASLEYTGIIKDGVYKYKYGKKAYMYKLFGELLIKTIESEKLTNHIDLIVPVPLHRSKMLDRGFNQAELLAKYLSMYYNIPIDSKNLIRVRKTLIQNKLDKNQRQKNVKNAFSVKKDKVFKEKRILLVDDIYTTGATVNECSKILMKAGANEVFVLTIARGADKK